MQNWYWTICCILHEKRASVSMDSPLVSLGNDTTLETQIWPLLLPSWAFTNRGGQASLSETALLSLWINHPCHYGHFVHTVISLFWFRSENHILLCSLHCHSSSTEKNLQSSSRKLHAPFTNAFVRPCMSSGNTRRVRINDGLSGYT